MGSERVFQSDQSNDVELTVPVGVVTVHVVAEDLTAARVAVTTTDTEGPCADAVRSVTARQASGRLIVTVPEFDYAEGVTVVDADGGYISVRQNMRSLWTGSVAGTVIVNGRVVGAEPGRATGRLRVEVWLPVGGGLVLRTRSADVEARGPLALGWLDAESVSGDVRLHTVDALTARSTSGDVRVRHVRRSASVSTVSGDVRIAAYGGQSAELRSVSGDVLLAAAEPATGRVRVRSVSGDIDLEGCARLDVQARTISGCVQQS